MKFRTLGASDLVVSEIALGSWLTYGLDVEADAARECVAAAFDAGINFIDTANAYGRGKAEAFLGETLAGRPRDSYVLATKLYFPMSDSDKGLSAAQVAKQLDASLERLKTDHIDLYQCHRYDADTPLEETMTALNRAVESGKVRYIGFSEWSPDQIEAAIALADEKSLTAFVSSQPQYSLLWRRIEDRVIPISATNGISQIVWSPLAQGVLTGKYDPDAPPAADSRAADQNMGAFIDRFMDPVILRAVQELKPLAAEAGVSVARFALAWVLREPNIASAIIGASRPAQVYDNAAASDDVIDPALFAEAERIVAEAEQLVVKAVA